MLESKNGKKHWLIKIDHAQESTPCECLCAACVEAFATLHKDLVLAKAQTNELKNEMAKEQRQLHDAQQEILLQESTFTRKIKDVEREFFVAKCDRKDIVEAMEYERSLRMQEVYKREEMIRIDNQTMEENRRLMAHIMDLNNELKSLQITQQRHDAVMKSERDSRLKLVEKMRDYESTITQLEQANNELRSKLSDALISYVPSKSTSASTLLPKIASRLDSSSLQRAKAAYKLKNWG